jgi:hypothetical protein
MAITNAQQYQQLVNKSANGKRPGYRGDGGYQGGGGGGGNNNSGGGGGNNNGGGGGGNNNGGGGGGGGQDHGGNNNSGGGWSPGAGSPGTTPGGKNKNKGGGNVPGPGDTGGEGGYNPKDDSTSQYGGGKDNTGAYDEEAAKKQKEKEKKAEQQRIAAAKAAKEKAAKEKAAKEKADAIAKAIKEKEEEDAARAKELSDLGKTTAKDILGGLTNRERYLAEEIYGVDSKDIYEGDLSSELQTFNTSKAVGDTPIDQEFTGTLNEREQALQDFLDRRNEVKTFGISSLFQKPLQKVSDFNASINRPFFEDVIRGGKIPGLDFDMTADQFEDAYQSYMSDRLSGKTDAYGNPTSGYSRDASGNIIGSGPDGGDNYVPPIVVKKDDTDEDDTTPTVNPRDYTGLGARFMGSQFDFSGLADGGIARVGYMDGGMPEYQGGIMDLETGRQQYFLGKLVKKATRAVKKVVKSPFGKAALLYGLGSLGAGALGKYKAGTGGSGFFSKAGRYLLGTKGVDEDGGTMGLLGKFGLTGGFGGKMPTLKGGIVGGLAGLTALDLLGVGKEEDEALDLGPGIDINAIRNSPYRYLAPRFTGSQYEFADGGRIGYAEGSKEPVAKETMPLLDMDNQEMDLRAEGGFVPIGRMERADDVPARLSKNEFVFTADAVRNAGEGDIDKGAEVMYNMMKNLESGGEVSEESQGLEGAREMFQTSQRLEEVL